MRHHATQAIFSYWNELRAGRRAPRRLEIDPQRLGGLLLDSFILERTSRTSFDFRLAGTRISSWLGTDLRTRNFFALWGEADRAMLERHFAAIVELGRVGVFTGEAGFASGPEAAQQTATFELIVLPLMHTGQAIDRLLCLLVALDDEAPGPSGAAQAIKLLAAEEIWPDGPAEDTLGLAGDPPALHPTVRTARIVRDGRRQFRVYQGGRPADSSDTAADIPPGQ